MNKFEPREIQRTRLLETPRAFYDSITKIEYAPITGGLNVDRTIVRWEKPGAFWREMVARAFRGD